MQLLFKKYNKVIFVFFAAAIISAVLLWVFEERFDADVWKARPLLRYKMVDDLIEKELLIGASKADVIVLLGTVYTTNLNEDDTIIYRLGKGPSFSEAKEELLFVVFENDRVLKMVHSTQN